MLNIKIEPDCLIFVKLSTELWEKFYKEYNLTVCKGGHYVKGTPEELFKILLKLSYTYDIELS